MNRAAWACQTVTNWIGYGGFPQQLVIELRGPVVVGYSVWCRCVVNRKDVLDGQYLVGLDIFVENHRGERMARGSAEVVLPTS